MRATIGMMLPGEPHAFRRNLRFAALKCSARRQTFTGQDLRDFLMAYCACFLAVSVFIA